MDVKTTQLLKKSTLQLEYFQYSVESRSPETDYGTTETYLSIVKKLFRNGAEGASEISRLYSAIDHTIRRYRFEPTRGTGTNVYKTNYSGGIVRYRSEDIPNVYMDASLMPEKDGSDVKAYILVLEFPVNAFYYNSIDIDSELVPSFASDAISYNKDLLSWSILSCKISDRIIKYCNPVVEGKQYTIEEYSKEGIEPFLPAEARIRVERALTRSASRRKAMAKKQFKSVKTSKNKCEIYEFLLPKYIACRPKPNETARLFAVLYEILFRSSGYERSYEEFNEWPGEMQNSGNLTETKHRVKKINKRLIPSFDPAEKTLDLQRISTLDSWITAMDGALIFQLILRLTTATCWLFWICCYMAQMNPLIGPKLHNTTVLLVARAWGNAVTM